MQTRHCDSVSTSLFSDYGERKYLNERERKRYYNALPILTKPSDRTFCETIFWTGCRPSEAMQLDFMRVDIEDGFLVFRTLKKRGKNKGKHYRIVPIPKSFARRLNHVHGVRKLQKQLDADLSCRLWPFSRQTGWLRIKLVMNEGELRLGFLANNIVTSCLHLTVLDTRPFRVTISITRLPCAICGSLPRWPI